MLNSLCSPEMSFNSEIHPGPFALVHYDEEGTTREIVPLSFINSFDKAWRTKGWRKNYLYKVFWSSEDSDSPTVLLSRVAEIPVFERGSTQQKPGYYRATVVAVKETRAELEELMEGRRLRPGIMSMKHTSFDDPKISAAPAARGRGSARNKGIDRKAQIANTSDLAAELDDKFSAGSSKPESTLGSKKSKCVEATSILPKGKRQTRFSSNSGQKAPGGVTKSSSSDSDSDSVTVLDKKFKLDPDFTPKKYIAVKEELEVQKNSVKRLSDLNYRLQHSLLSEQEKNIELLEKVKSLEEKVTNLTKNDNCNPIPGCKTFVREVPSQSLKKPTSEALSPMPPAGNKVKEELLPTPVLPVDAAVKTSAIPTDDLCNEMLELDSLGSNGSGKLKIKDGSEGLEDDIKKEPLEVDGTSSAEKFKDTTAKGYELCEGVIISSELMDVINCIPSGPKRDNKFIKDLAISAFGPEVLASRTIHGTARGSRKKADELASGEKPQKKAPLNRNIYNAILAKFIKRIEEEENVKLKDPEENERTKISKFDAAIRGAQNRVRSLGYGKGTKTNTASKATLMEY